MPCVQLGYRETKGLRHLLWIRLCRAIDIHIIWVVIMPLLEAAYDPGAQNGFLSSLPTLCGPTGSHA